jgi:surface antigen
MLGVLVGASPAQAETGGYPYASGPTCATNNCTADPWRFYQRECTSFVAWKLNTTNGFAFKNDFDGNGTLDFGSANNWGPAAQSFGFPVNMTPAVGAVAWWSSTHVAWVEAVNGDNVTIQEYNYGYTGNYNRRVINKNSVSGYIHFKDIGANQPATNVTRDVNADGRSDLVIANPGPNGSGMLEGHVLSGATNFTSWLGHWPTAAGYLGANDKLLMGDVNGDGRSDLIIVGTAGTGSGKLEVHALNGNTGFSSWLGHWVTPANYLGSNDRLAMGDVNHDDRADLLIIGTGPTGSGKLEAHVLSGSSNFSSWLGNWPTAAGYSGSGDQQLAGDINGDGRADLLIVGFTSSTGSGKIEVHALDGATNYSTWLGHYVTAANPLGATDRLVMGDVNGDGRSDLSVINTTSTGSGKLEVHPLNAATNFSSYIDHYVTTSDYTGSTDRILMGG